MAEEHNGASSAHEAAVKVMSGNFAIFARGKTPGRKQDTLPAIQNNNNYNISIWTRTVMHWA